MIQLSRVGWRLLACENGASPDCIIVVAVVVAAVVAVSYASIQQGVYVYFNNTGALIAQACAESPGSKLPQV